ncbi:hypothetical protein [Rhodococcoides yunnanense]|uniref:hypothetical protein n=1 Tax=Rhodococcoides yunnanense TaxID=278209 RepID=UPI0009338EE3|nr:hypothetical protein [Rhodococcus yunnanensis]
MQDYPKYDVKFQFEITGYYDGEGRAIVNVLIDWRDRESAMEKFEQLKAGHLYEICIPIIEGLGLDSTLRLKNVINEQGASHAAFPRWPNYRAVEEGAVPTLMVSLAVDGGGAPLLDEMRRVRELAVDCRERYRAAVANLD